MIAIACIILPPFVIPIITPWSEINCASDEINIKTGQKRHIIYFWYFKISNNVKDTLLSTVLNGEYIDVADVKEWHTVYFLSPGFSHSPNFTFHGALSQISELERAFLISEPTPDRKRSIAIEMLKSWQIEKDDSAARDIIVRVYEECLNKSKANKQ